MKVLSRISYSSRLCARVCIPSIAIIAAMALAMAVPYAHGQTANPQCTKEIDTQVSSGLTGTLTFQDQCGTQAGNFEMLVSGAPATVSVTINGCMRGGTCTALNSSTSTTNAVLPVSGGPYDNYQIAYTMTGGTSPVLTFNRTGASAQGVMGGYSGVQNAITVSGNNHIYRASNLCKALALATGTELSGTLWATGFQGTQVCGAADLTNMVNPSYYGLIVLGCPLNWWFPLVSQGAQSGNTPRLGVVPMNVGVNFIGCGTAGSPPTNATTIRICPTSGGPTGCTAPQTHSFAISNVTLAYADSRTYFRMTGSGMDIVAREPVRLANYQNVAGNSLALTIGQNTQVISGRLDPGIPNNPTSTEVDAPVNSGIWTATITGNGSGGIAGTLTTTWSGGGCVTEPTSQETLSGGSLTSVTILNRGRGCTSAPTATVTGSVSGSGTLGSTVAAGCGASCGVIHAEIPIFDLAPTASAAMSMGLQKLIISCSNLDDCVPIRCLACQEQTELDDLFLTAIHERGIDAHTFSAQNSSAWRHIRVTSGPSPSNDVAMEAVYIGDAGPHGIEDFTGDFSASTQPIDDCIRIDADAGFGYVQGSHCENALFGVLGGDSNPLRGWRISDIAGAPQAFSITTGQYQNEAAAAVKIRSEYYTNAAPVAAITTSDYLFMNVSRNNANSGVRTISDDNPLGGSASGYNILDTVTELYAVDTSTSGCQTVLSSAQQGTWTTCAPWFIAGAVPAKTTIGGLSTFCPSTGINVGMHAVASNCNAACSAGGTCTAGGANVCEVYCTSAGSWLETGR